MGISVFSTKRALTERLIIHKKSSHKQKNIEFAGDVSNFSDWSAHARPIVISRLSESINEIVGNCNERHRFYVVSALA